MSLSRALIQTLESLERAGVSELPRLEKRCWPVPVPAQVVHEPAKTVEIAAESVMPPVRKLAQAISVAEPIRPVEELPPSTRAATSSAPPASPTGGWTRPVSPPVLTGDNSPSVERFMKAPVLSLAERQQCLASLAQKVSRCKKCDELARTRTQTVFGVGNPLAKVMFIGEAPGADEDKQGEPFVGRAGQLLDKIIQACGWQREELYICNILRCRPPGNRNPTPVEASHCREYLDGQIETVNPKFIVCWGTIAAQNLLGNTTPIGRLRGQIFKYGRSKVLCTYHPSYLLRNPSAKKHVWEDLKILLREMGIDPDQLNPGKA